MNPFQTRLEAADHAYWEQFAIVNSLELELSSARTAGDDGLREHHALLKRVEYFDGLDLLMEKDHEDEIAKLEAELADIEVRFDFHHKRNN